VFTDDGESDDFCDLSGQMSDLSGSRRYHNRLPGFGFAELGPILQIIYL
jgi:hypothetical protein